MEAARRRANAVWKRCPTRRSATYLGQLPRCRSQKSRGAVQQGQCRFVVGQLFHGVGQALHLPHGAQRAQQGAGDEDLVGGVIGFLQVEVRVGHGQCGFAEQLAGWVGAVGDDAAAQVDEVAAQGQVAVHVDVGAVHGQRGPVLGHFRRRASAQQFLGAGAAEIQGRRPTAAVRPAAAPAGMPSRRSRVSARRWERLWLD